MLRSTHGWIAGFFIGATSCAGKGGCWREALTRGCVRSLPRGPNLCYIHSCLGPYVQALSSTAMGNREERREKGGFYGCAQGTDCGSVGSRMGAAPRLDASSHDGKGGEEDAQHQQRGREREREELAERSRRKRARAEEMRVLRVLRRREKRHRYSLRKRMSLKAFQEEQQQHREMAVEAAVNAAAVAAAAASAAERATAMAATHSSHRCDSAVDNATPLSSLEHDAAAATATATAAAATAATAAAAALRTLPLGPGGSPGRLRGREKEACKERLQEANRGKGPRLLIDLSFAEDQSPRERNSLVKQLGYAYNTVLTCASPPAFSISSCSGAISPLLKAQGVEGWAAQRLEKGFMESGAFNLQDVVFLSPDADEELESLEDGKVYCIGGIVDRTVRKHQTRNTARDQGIRCVKLPFRRFHPSSSADTVLNINTVVSILVLVKENGGDWGQAFRQAVPKRKLTPRHQQRKEREESAFDTAKGD